MSKLNDLRSKGKEITLSNEMIITISPMTLDIEADISDFYKEEKFTKAISHMVKDAVKIAIPDATDDEINNINKEDLKLITETVLEMNGLSESKKKDN